VTPGGLPPVTGPCQGSRVSAGRPARGVVRLLVGAAAVAVLALAAVLLAPGPLQMWLYGSRASGVACADLPSVAQVQAALDEHADVVRRIEDVGDQVDVLLTATCEDPSRAELVVVYPGRHERREVEAILSRHDLGVPVSWQNA